MRTQEVQFVGLMADAIPEGRSVLRAHLEEQDAEILPHVFMADLTRWLLGLFASAGREDQRVRVALGLMERAFDSSDAVRELITAPFLENLPGVGEPQSDIRDLLGPRLREQLSKMG